MPYILAALSCLKFRITSAAAAAGVHHKMLGAELRAKVSKRVDIVFEFIVCTG